MRWVKWFVVLTWLVLLLGIATASAGIALAANQEEQVRSRVTQYLEARWNLLVNQNLPLESFYDREGASQAIAASARQRVEDHYLQPARQAGLRYTTVKVLPQFKQVEVSGDVAQVVVVVNVEYTSLDEAYERANPGKPWPIVTKEAGLEYNLQLVHRNGHWLVAGDQHTDTFSKRGTASTDQGDKAPRSTTPRSDVGIQWWRSYNRAGAAAYADTWWDSNNPKYRSFSVDCANFVSQSFYEGGTAAMAWKTPYVWWYDFKGTSSTSDDTWSYGWSGAHDQPYNLSRNTDPDEMRGTYVSTAGELGLGDSIYYDFGVDGILDHSAIVVEIRNGEPYVDYHTNNTFHRHWNLGANTTRFLRVASSFWVY